METIEPFLYVLAIGGPICAATWWLGRKLIRRSHLARAFFCFLVAASVTPTVVKIFYSWSVIPAVAWASITFSGDKNWIYGFLYGILPILFVAGIAFWILSANLRRRDLVA